MIKWRRDRGQTAMEYVGLIAVVAAIILALALSGVGGQITNGLQSAICSLTGSSCPATGDGGETVEAGSDTEDQPGPATDGGAVTGGTTGGGTSGDTGDGTGDTSDGGTHGGTGDGTDNGASGGGEDTGSTSEAA